jgi:methionyl-tRNA synthetase
MAQWSIPSGANAVLDLLAQQVDHRSFSHLTTMIAAGTELPTPSGIFPRLEMAD